MSWQAEFRDDRLVEVYDAECPWSGDDEYFLAAVGEVPGARVADVGCGTGQALIALARAFPAITATGYDVHPPAVERARRAAAAAGVADRVAFQVLDVTAGLPESFDVITTFDVVHDAVDPLGLLRSIRDALRPGGRYLCLEINCSDQAAGNTGPIAALLYGFSILYCMTTSLAEGGEGLGTLGLPEPVLRQLAGKAGFTQVRHVEMDNPFNRLYELAVPVRPRSRPATGR